MLKFFRKYMNYILAVFVALLMVAFLIQPTLSMFGPDPTGEVIGTIESDELTVGDQRQANSQLLILEQLSPILAHLASSTPGQPPSALQWLLMLRDAHSMGLAASKSQVESLLDTLGRNRSKLASVARTAGVSVDTLLHALENWLVVQAYKELVSGLIHAPVAQRVGHYTTAGQFLQYGYYQGAVVEIESAFRGSPRLSPPMLERFLHDHRATAQITAVVFPYQRYLQQTSQPSEASVDDLFHRYKASLPGESEPYGLGYRIRDRVKIEYLSIPIDMILPQTRVEEADALSYYDNHRDAFRIPAPTTAPTTQTDDALQPYEQVRGQIIDQLKNEKAAQLADRIIKTAQGMMLEDARQLTEDGDYRTIPAHWQPIGLLEVAKKVQQQFGIAPKVHHRDDQWLTASELAMLTDIGTSQVSVGQQVVPFVQYVLSAKELLDANSNHPLASLRLQLRLPSMPLKSSDGGRLLFRLIDAQASRVPTSIDEVRDQVTADVRSLAAYERLKAEASSWLAQAQDEEIESWASKQGLSVVKPPPFPKRLSGPTGRLSIPDISGLGRSEALVDAVFDLVDQLAHTASDTSDAQLSAETDIGRLPTSQRTQVIAVDQLMNLIVFRVDQLEPISRSRYESIAQSPQLGAWINQSLMAQHTKDPLSITALSRRVGFEPTYRNDRLSSEDPTDDDTVEETTAP